MVTILTLTKRPDHSSKKSKLIAFEFGPNTAAKHWETLSSGVLPDDIRKHIKLFYPGGFYITSIGLGQLDDEDFKELDIEIKELN